MLRGANIGSKVGVGGGEQVSDACLPHDAANSAANQDFELCRGVFDNAPENIVVFDNNGRILKANDRFLAFVGKDAQEVEGRFPGEFPVSVDFTRVREIVLKVVAQRSPQQLQFPVTKGEKSGQLHRVDLIPILDKDGQCIQVAAFGRDIADIDELRSSATNIQNQLHAAVRVLPDIFWIKDHNGKYLLTNEQFDAFNKAARGSTLGKTAQDLAQGAVLEEHLRTDRLALGQREPVRFTLDIPDTETGDIKHYEVQKVAIRDEDGQPTGMLGMARDVTLQRVLQDELATREREYRQLAEHLPDCLVRFNAEMKPIYMNSALKQILINTLDIPPERLRIGLKIAAAQHFAFERMRTVVSKVFSDGESDQVEAEFTRSDGSVIIHEVRFFPEYDEAGEVVTVLGIGRDVTERRAAEAELKSKERELKKLAYTDSLTGLANRTTFAGSLKLAVEKAVKDGGKVALLTLDLDRFKAVNDTLGHSAGDEMLREVARRLKRATKSKVSWMGRLGGDEFALIVPGAEDTAKIESLCADILDKLSDTMALGGNAVKCSASIGITLAPDDSTCTTTLFKFSDIALYQAKAKGRAMACRYTADMSQATNQRFEFEAMINEGLNCSQFKAFFQAKIDLKTSRICGAEALCRWEHPERGFIPPCDFIPVAEESGQIIEIGRLIMRQACEFAVACNAVSREPITVAVNVSARQLLYGGLLGTIGLCLEETGCKPEWLELEITESLLLNDNDVVVEALNAISELGIQISIDDFGTGYSALSYLHRFPISVLKIDQSFIREMETVAKQQVLVRAILAMAQGLGLKTVAEGVESDGIVAKLKALGCDMGQGYVWHKPLPAEKLLDVLRGAEIAEALAQGGVATNRA